MLTPLEVPGWVEFNSWRTGFKAHHVALGETATGPQLRAILYLDGRGRVRFPVGNPYVPIVFHSPHRTSSGRTADWLKLTAPLVDEMKGRGVPNATSLGPEVDDIRPWSWRGFQVGVGYTYFLDFPFDPSLSDRGARRNVERASKLGMTVERVRDADLVLECLAETESRKGFSHHLRSRDLGMADALMGPENLRMYACFDSQRRVASACVVLHSPGARAAAWVAGTKTSFMASGAGHLLWRHLFDDLAEAGATGLDFCGANIGAVAEFKSRWNPRLVPSFHVRTYSTRAGVRFMAEWLQSRRRAPRSPGNVR